MINRTIVRIRVIQNLFAYYKDGDKTLTTARKELLKSLGDTYTLYMLLLEFVNELTHQAEVALEEQKQRARVLHHERTFNRHFVDNRLARQVFDCEALRRYVADEKLSWDCGHNAILSIYRALVESEEYKRYMDMSQPTYEDDKRIWRFIIGELMPSNEDLTSALEEMEVQLDAANWAADMDVVLSYVLRTIKRAKADCDFEVMPMFDKEEELQFAQDLLRAAIDHYDAYQEAITAHLKNWEADRVPYMDKIILCVALAEIYTFHDIALQVSLNEYIEIAKEYSGEKSYIFVNGILNEILQEEKKDGTLLKAKTIK